MTMLGRSMVGIPSRLEDSHFSLETISKIIEDTFVSELKEYLGIKVEVLQDLDFTERHKVIEITTYQPNQN